jgi:LPS-assembly protein
LTARLFALLLLAASLSLAPAAAQAPDQEPAETEEATPPESETAEPPSEMDPEAASEAPEPVGDEDSEGGTEAGEATEQVGRPPEPAEPLEDPDRIDFTLQLEDGQGTVTGGARSLEFRREDYAVLSGQVEIRHEDFRLRADSVEVDLATQDVIALGNVIMDQGPRRLSGKTMTFNLESETGTLTEASAFVDPDYYFTGREISKVGEDVYSVVDGVFTACDQEVPDWSFRLSRARVEVEGYAYVHNARLNVKKAPIFYTPYIVYPTKTERSAGLLIPNFGYSERRGYYLGMAYFQPLGRSYDTTLYLDGYSEGFVGVGNEFRYAPTQGTAGQVESYVIRDEETDDWRWRVDLDHESNDLPLGMRGVVDWTEYSDFEFFRDFERDFDRNSLRFEESKAFLTGNWGTHLVNLQITDRETFSGDRINVDRQLPALEYRLRSTPIVETPIFDAPLYLSVNSSVAGIQVDRSATYDSTYQRADLFPQISLPIEPAPWLSLSLNAGARATWWSDSLETDPAVVTETGSSFTGESLSRTIGTYGAELIGPSISRVFDAAIGPFGRFKHIVEPRVTYSYTDDFDEQSEVPSFDSVDRLFSGNLARFSLINRLKAKPADPEAGDAAREILTFELTQRYSFDDEAPLERGRASLDDPEAEILESQSSPLEAILRFAPSVRTGLRAEWEYSTLFNQLTSSSIAANHRFGLHDVDLRFTTRFQPQDGETTRNQLRFATGLALIPRKLGLRASLDYDIEQSLLQEQRYFLDWTSQCYSIRLEYRDFEAGQTRDTDYRVAFTLKNVGTFLDLTGRVE